MSRLPKYNPWRPDFEAPGPHVRIEKHKGLSFDTPVDRERDDEDEDFSAYRYYESEKILGKLYRYANLYLPILHIIVGVELPLLADYPGWYRERHYQRNVSEDFASQRSLALRYEVSGFCRSSC